MTPAAKIRNDWRARGFNLTLPFYPPPMLCKINPLVARAICFTPLSHLSFRSLFAEFLEQRVDVPQSRDLIPPHLYLDSIVYSAGIDGPLRGCEWRRGGGVHTQGQGEAVPPSRQGVDGDGNRTAQGTRERVERAIIGRRYLCIAVCDFVSPFFFMLVFCSCPFSLFFFSMLVFRTFYLSTSSLSDYFRISG